MRRFLALLGALCALAGPAWALPFFTTYGFAPITHVYTSGTAATETVPSGSKKVSIEDWGGGGGCAVGSPFNAGPPPSGPLFGGGGGSSAYSLIVLTLTSSDWGKTFTYTVGAAGAPAGNGGASTTVNGTDTQSVSLSDPGGNTGTVGFGGTGGSPAAGGSTNQNGASGSSSGSGAAATTGLNGAAYGAGATSFGFTSCGASGQSGGVSFFYQ